MTYCLFNVSGSEATSLSSTNVYMCGSVYLYIFIHLVLLQKIYMSLLHGYMRRRSKFVYSEYVNVHRGSTMFNHVAQ